MTQPKRPEISLYFRNCRFKKEYKIKKKTLDEVIVILHRIKYPSALLTREYFQKTPKARVIKIWNERKEEIQFQYDFHCFHCKKIWDNFNLLLEHWKYYHVTDFSVLNIDLKSGGDVHVVISKKLNKSGLKFFDPVTLEELPTSNISTFASVNLFYNFSFNEMNDLEKNQMKTWVQKIGEEVNKNQIQTIIDINTTDKKVYTFEEFKTFIKTHQPSNNDFWMEYITFLRSIFVNQKIIKLTELEQLEKLIFQRMKKHQLKESQLIQ